MDGLLESGGWSRCSVLFPAPLGPITCLGSALRRPLARDGFTAYPLEGFQSEGVIRLFLEAWPSGGSPGSESFLRLRADFGLHRPGHFPDAFHSLSHTLCRLKHFKTRTSTRTASRVHPATTGSLPKFRLLSVVFGLPGFRWFGKLNASARNSTVCF